MTYQGWRHIDPKPGNLQEIVRENIPLRSAETEQLNFSKSMLFPGNDQCIALLLSFNLASHQWIDIPCTRNLAMIFVCQLNTSENLNNQNISFYPARIGCNPDAFKINVICYLFVVWPMISQYSAEQLCQTHNMFPS